MRIVLLCTLIAATGVHAQNTAPSTVRTAERTTQVTTSTSASKQPTMVDTSDRLALEVWGLTPDELQRAKLLLKGPRAAFSIPNLSPVEALGIHARTEAERRKYAEKFAKAAHDDTERVLAWEQAYQAAMQRLYPGQRVVDYTNVPPANVSLGAAAAANVPKTLVRPARPPRP